MRTERPTGVSILAIWYFLGGLAYVATALLVLFTTLDIPGLEVLATFQIIGGLVSLILGVLQFATGWGLWELRNWGRTMAAVFAAMALLGNLASGIMLLIGVDIGGFRLQAPGPGIACLILAIVQGLIIYYLYRPEVAQAFEGGGYEYDDAPYLEPTVQATVRSPEPSTTPQPAAPARPRTELTRPIVRGRPAMAWLAVTRGPWSGRQFGLDAGRNSLGRDASRCDIPLDDDAVSGQHARVDFERGQFVIYDLASTNGTFVNSRRVQRQSLMDDDVIRIGNTTFVFKQVKTK